MSTDLKSRSKAYNLLRVSVGGGNVGVVVSQGYNKPSVTLDIPEIEYMFGSGDFSRLNPLDILDETRERLQLDLAQFAVTKGSGMEAY